MRLFLGLAFSVLVFAAAYAASDANEHFRWHDPTVLASIDEAAKDITNSRPFIREQHQYKEKSQTPLYFVENFIIERDGIGFVASRTDIQTTSQWVPSWGGSWIGGQYVPYSGGTSVVTQTPKRSEATIWFAYSDVSMLLLTQWTKDNPDNQWPWCLIVALQGAEGDLVPQTINFCAKRADQTRKVFDALFTLVASWSVRADKYQLRFISTGGAMAPSDPDLDVQRRFKKLGWTKTTGYLVGIVVPGSPAEAAGIRTDDIIFEAGGVPVVGSADYRERVWAAMNEGKPNGSLEVKVFREGQELTLTLTNLKAPYFGWERLRQTQPATAPPTQ